MGMTGNPADAGDHQDVCVFSCPAVEKLLGEHRLKKLHLKAYYRRKLRVEIA